MSDRKRVGAIIPAAGKGKRLSGGQSKQLLELDGKPILLHTVEHFQSSSEIDLIVVTADSENIEKIKNLIQMHSLSKVKHVVLGGAERQDSVFEGLRVLQSEEVDLVIVHDAVRPFVTQKQIHSVLRAASEVGAAIVAVPPKDTIKISQGNSYVQTTLPRENLWIVQTPQAFQFPLLYNSHEKAHLDGYRGTDDASIVEWFGGKVQIVEGSYDNIKITTPSDLELAQLISRRLLIKNT